MDVGELDSPAAAASLLHADDLGNTTNLERIEDLLFRSSCELPSLSSPLGLASSQISNATATTNTFSSGSTTQRLHFADELAIFGTASNESTTSQTDQEITPQPQVPYQIENHMNSADEGDPSKDIGVFQRISSESPILNSHKPLKSIYAKKNVDIFSGSSESATLTGETGNLIKNSGNQIWTNRASSASSFSSGNDSSHGLISSPELDLSQKQKQQPQQQQQQLRIASNSSSSNSTSSSWQPFNFASKHNGVTRQAHETRVQTIAPENNTRMGNNGSMTDFAIRDSAPSATLRCISHNYKQQGQFATLYSDDFAQRHAFESIEKPEAIKSHKEIEKNLDRGETVIFKEVDLNNVPGSAYGDIGQVSSPDYNKSHIRQPFTFDTEANFLALYTNFDPFSAGQFSSCCKEDSHKCSHMH